MSPFTPSARAEEDWHGCSSSLTRYVTLFCRTKKKKNIFSNGQKQPLLVPAILPSSSLEIVVVVVVKLPTVMDEDILDIRLTYDGILKNF